MFFLFLLTYFIQPLFAQSYEADLLLNSFKNYCPQDFSQNERLLTTQTDALISTLSKLKEREECQFSDILSLHAENYQKAVGLYSNFNDQKLKRLSLEKQMISYTQMIDSGNYTETEVGYLENALFNAQLEILGIQDKEMRRFTFIGSKAENASQAFISEVNTFLELNKKNPDCYSNAQQLSSLISGTIGGASFFLSPVTSIAVNTVAGLGQRLAEVFRQKRYNRSIRQFNQAKMIDALQCSSLTLSRNYCDADNSIRVIDNYIQMKKKKTKTLFGIDLLGRKLINTDNWLRKVVSGSVIRRSGNFQDWQNRQREVDLLRIMAQELSTFEFESRQFWQFITDGKQLSQAVINGINDLLAGPMRAFNNSNPVFRTRDVSLFAFQLLTPSLNAIPLCPYERGQPTDSNSSQCSIIDYVDRVYKKQFLDLEDWRIIIKRAKEVVEFEFLNAQSNLRRVRTLDPETLFSNTKLMNGEFRNVSGELENVIKILSQIKNYLSDRGCLNKGDACRAKLTADHPHYDVIDDIDKTSQMTLDVSKMIKSALHISNPLYYPKQCSFIFEEIYVASKTCDKDGENCQEVKRVRAKPSFNQDLKQRAYALADCISQILELDERGNLIFFDRLKFVVQYELESRLKDGDFSNHVEELLFESRSELIENIKFQNQGSLSLARDQLEETKEKSKQALKNYWAVFEKSFIKLLESYELETYNLRSLCLRSLTYLPLEKDNKKKNEEKNTKWRERKIDEFFSQIYPYCSGVNLTHYEQGPSIKWADYIEKRDGLYQFSQKPERQRLCLTDIYNRRVRIYEDRELEGINGE